MAVAMGVPVAAVVPGEVAAPRAAVVPEGVPPGETPHADAAPGRATRPVRPATVHPVVVLYHRTGARRKRFTG